MSITTLRVRRLRPTDPHIPHIPFDIEPPELTAIQRWRTIADLIITHTSTHDRSDAIGLDHNDISHARSAIVEATPASERITITSWADVVAYCATASMDATVATQESFVGCFIYAFEQLLTTRYGMTPDQLPAALRDEGQSRITPSDYAASAEALCRDIKRDQDQHFVIERYDTLPFESTIPKPFWADAFTETTDEESTQVGLDLF